MRTLVRRLPVIVLSLFLVIPACGQAPAPESGGENGEWPTLAPVLEQVTPAVVNIAVESRAPAEQNPLFRDPFFRRFFDLPEMPPGRPRLSAGSGVIVDAKKGYVLTNHHVIDKGEEIVVTLKDGRRFEAELMGSDPGTDIALLKIDAKNLHALKLGDSDRLRVGDYVVAIGNPFGLGQTVTSGIVSALGRTGLNVNGYEDFIQTDAPINPGNSGGALITLNGRLVGINSAIVSPAGGNVGIGFAVPSNMARAVMEQLIEYGEVRRGRLGILVMDLTPDLAAAMDVEATRGAVVSSVEPGTPADKAGLKPGDVIVEADGETVTGSSDLRNTIGLMRLGAKVKLTVLREGERKQLTATLKEAEETGARGGDTSPRLEGAVFRNLPPDHAAYGEVEGVLVAQVAPGSRAQRFGLKRGDIVTAVNRQPVSSVKELKSILEEAGGALALSIVRGNARLFIVVR